jgi:hypothetical protein
VEGVSVGGTEADALESKRAKGSDGTPLSPSNANKVDGQENPSQLKQWLTQAQVMRFTGFNCEEPMLAFCV